MEVCHSIHYSDRRGTRQRNERSSIGDNMGKEREGHQAFRPQGYMLRSSRDGSALQPTPLLSDKDAWRPRGGNPSLSQPTQASSGGSYGMHHLRRSSAPSRPSSAVHNNIPTPPGGTSLLGNYPGSTPSPPTSQASALKTSRVRGYSSLPVLVKPQESPAPLSLRPGGGRSSKLAARSSAPSSSAMRMTPPPAPAPAPARPFMDGVRSDSAPALSFVSLRPPQASNNSSNGTKSQSSPSSAETRRSSTSDKAVIETVKSMGKENEKNYSAKPKSPVHEEVRILKRVPSIDVESRSSTAPSSRSSSLSDQDEELGLTAELPGNSEMLAFRIGELEKALAESRQQAVDSENRAAEAVKRAQQLEQRLHETRENGATEVKALQTQIRELQQRNQTLQDKLRDESREKVESIMIAEQAFREANLLRERHRAEIERMNKNLHEAMAREAMLRRLANISDREDDDHSDYDRLPVFQSLATGERYTGVKTA